MTEEIAVVVIGAGAAGVSAANLIHAAGVDVAVLEARDRVGGRLLSPRMGSGRLDLGATWFWPNEPLVNRVVTAQGVESFPQHLAGDTVVQTDSGVQRLPGNQLDVPSSRLVSGAQSIVEAQAQHLPAGAVRLNSPVQSLLSGPECLTLETGDATWRAGNVIIAVPPATAVARIDFGGQLPDRLAGLAAITPVWMGATTKVVARYDTPFWRMDGLAGAAFSHVGPMREIHDMSGPDGSPAALFGFAQPNPGEPSLSKEAVMDQLEAIFGPQSRDIRELVIHDWRQEEWTSPEDVERLTAYQAFGHELFQTPALGGRLHWASTETATDSPGHIEGALSAGTRAANAVLRNRNERERKLRTNAGYIRSHAEGTS